MRLNDPLVTSILFQGVNYPLNLSFNNVLDILEILNNKNVPQDKKIEIVVKLLIGENSLDLFGRLELWKIVRETYIDIQSVDTNVYDKKGNIMPKAQKTSEKEFDLEHDAKYIYASFRQIGINLFEEQEKMHWEEFQALLEALPEDCILQKIIRIRTWKASKKGSKGIKDIALAMGLVKVASAAFGILKSSMDAAISRFDTFEKFPKVLEALGFEASESQEAIGKLSNGIDGLPTKLDDVVGTTQRMTAMTGNLNRSADATIALNNAMLASGASAADASRGTEQYVQMLAKGEVDMQSWRSLQETMPVGLQKTAEAMGMVGAAATTDLYDALKDGKVTFRDFETELIKLGTGTGELAKLAQVNSQGIATSFSNLKNAVAKGLANVLKSFDDLSKAVSGKTIAQNLDSLKGIVNKTFDAIVVAIKMTTPIVKVLISTLKILFVTAKTLSPVLMGVAAAFVALKVINTVNSMFKTASEAINKMKNTMMGLTLVTKSQMVAQLADNSATKANIAGKIAQNVLIKTSTALTGLFTGAVSLSSATMTIATAVTTAFGTAIKLLMGPIGWVTLAVGALVTAGVALFKWFNRETEAGKKLNEQQKELVDSTKELKDAVDNNAKARKDEIEHTDSSKAAYKNLAKEVSNLASKEKKSAGDKKILKDNVESLNTAFKDLNLVYDQESGKLSMTTKQIEEKIDAYGAMDKATEAQQQLLDIQKEEYEVGQKLKENTALREEWKQKLEAGDVTLREAAKATDELEEQEKSLITTQNSLQEEYIATTEIQKTASEIAAQAMEDGAGRQIITYETLSDAQKQSVDKMREAFGSLQESATNAFDKLANESEISLGQMVENLQHNQEVVRQWGDNQAALLAWAGENGYNSFIPFIENMGVDQAGVLAEMAKGIDGSNADQAALLAQLAQTYDAGFGTAVEAGKKSLSTGLAGVPQEINDMIIQPAASMNENVRVNFATLGKQAGDGAAGGIGEGKENVNNAVNDMFNGEAITGDIVKDMFSKKGAQVPFGTVEGIENNSKLVDESITSMIKPDAMNGDLIKQSFSGTGSQIPAGLAEGIQGNLGAVNTSVTDMATGIKDDFTNLLDIHSPSRVFEKNGGYIIDGLVLGLNNGVSKLKDAMNKLGQTTKSAGNQIVSQMKSTSSKIASAFNSLPGRMYTIGTQSMAGLNEGLSSGQSAVLSTAEGIANKVASTIKKALDIHSPSRVMRGLGRFIPQGLAVGIEDDAGKAYKAMNVLANDLLKPIRPEIALGINGLGNVNSGNKAVQRSSSLTNNQIEKLDKLVELTETLVNKDSNTYLDSVKVNKELAPGSDAVQGQRIKLSGWGLET